MADLIAGTNIKVLPADLSQMTVQERQKARAERHSVMEQAAVEMGADSDIDRVTAVSGTPMDKVAAMRAINVDIDRLDRSAKDGPVGVVGADGMIQPLPLPGSGHGRGTKQIPGWTAGYWSQPFLKASTGTLTPSGSVTVPALSGGITSINDRPNRILDVVPVTQLRGSDTYRYLKETVRTHNAGILAGSGTAMATKPTSTYSVVPVDGTVKVIAHLSQQIPRFTLQDANLLANYLDGSLREGVMIKLEDEIVNGDGTGTHFAGLTAAASIGTTVAFNHDSIFTARQAITALEASYIYGGVFVFSPSDWETTETMQVADGQFILGQQSLPVDRAQQKLWGRPVVVSNTLANGNAYLVDFAGSTQLWERDNITVDWSENVYDATAGRTDFEANVIRFRAEGRWGFGVLRPAGVIKFATAP